MRAGNNSKNLIWPGKIRKSEKNREITNLAENGRNDKIGESAIPGVKPSWDWLKAGVIWANPGKPNQPFALDCRSSWQGLACELRAVLISLDRREVWLGQFGISANLQIFSAHRCLASRISHACLLFGPAKIWARSGSQLPDPGWLAPISCARVIFSDSRARDLAARSGNPSPLRLSPPHVKYRQEDLLLRSQVSWLVSGS